MEFIFPIIFGFLSIPFWIFAAIAIFGFLEVVIFKSLKKKRLFHSIILLCSCLGIVVIGPFSIMIGPAILYDLSLELDRKERSKNAHRFWSEFFGSVLEKRLYNVQSEDDTVIREFQEMLERYKANVKFKVGPKHSTKRELAFVDGDIWPNKLVSRDLAYAASEISNPNWIIGIGFREPRESYKLSLDYGIGGKRYKVSEKDFQFRVSRSGNDLNLVIFTDAPISVDKWGKVDPVDVFLKQALGEYIYDYVLDQVEIEKLSDSPESTETVYLNNLSEECQNNMAEKHRKFLNSIIVSQSCVNIIPQVISEKDRLMGISWSAKGNSHLPKVRHMNGIWSERDLR